MDEIRKRAELIDAFLANVQDVVLGVSEESGHGECLGSLSKNWQFGSLFVDENIESALIQASIDGCADQTSARGLPGAGPIFLWGLPALAPCGLGMWLAGHLDLHAAGPLPFLPLALEEALASTDLDLWTVEGLQQALHLYPRRLAEAYLLASSNHRGEKPAFIDSLPQSLLVAPLLHQTFPDSRMLILRADTETEVQALCAAGMSTDEARRRQARFDRLAHHVSTRLGASLMRVELTDIYDQPEQSMARISAFLGYEKPAGACPLPSGWRAAHYAKNQAA